MNRRLHIFLLLLTLVLVPAITSCHSRRHTVRGNQAELAVFNNRRGKSSDATPKGDAKKVITESRRWIGTPYKYGGQTRRGMDCSGMVQVVYDNALGLKLPRSSRDMADYAKRISRKELRPADLVFFVSQPGGSRINHVAIYLGDGRIIHSTTSKGVIESNLDEGYWKSHFYCCGRVLK